MGGGALGSPTGLFVHGKNSPKRARRFAVGYRGLKREEGTSQHDTGERRQRGIFFATAESEDGRG